MTAYLPNGVFVTVLVACCAAACYGYQILSRPKREAAFRFKRASVVLPVYLFVTLILAQYIPPIEAIVAGGFVGLGAGWLFVKHPSRSRRISKTVHAKVIERDLTSKGLKWDSTKHHIDHVMPFSRGGDNSIRNLRVTEKLKNLSEGRKLPRFRDFIK